jgi:hypothetical protein
MHLRRQRMGTRSRDARHGNNRSLEEAPLLDSCTGDTVI